MNSYILKGLAEFPFNSSIFAQEFRNFQNYVTQHNKTYIKTFIHHLIDMIHKDFPNLTFIKHHKINSYKNIQLWFKDYTPTIYIPSNNREVWCRRINSKYTKWLQDCHVRIYLALDSPPIFKVDGYNRSSIGYAKNNIVGIKVNFNWDPFIIIDS